MQRIFFACVLLATAVSGQDRAAAPALPALAFGDGSRPAWPLDHVIYDEAGDGTLWARGATWKASFAKAGFAYLPALPGAPRSFQLGFRVAALRVDGEELSIDADVRPRRDADRVSFERGALREIYDLELDSIEQSFAITCDRPGEIEVELALVSELVEDAEQPGLQFLGEHGGVAYGAAFAVCGGAKRPIETRCEGSTLHLRVPAALRAGGEIVIDPVLTTQAAAPPGLVLSPDVAYDAASDRYLVVWETEFSEMDHDVHSVLFDAAGNPIAGSGAGIDLTAEFVVHPRVANLNVADRFLVVTSKHDPLFGGRQMVYGRVRDASGAATLHPAFLLSDPGLPGDNYIPDVGADPGTEPGDHDWLVVWACSLSGNSAVIQGRLVQSDGQPRGSTVLPIHSVPSARNWYVDVSRSNGNGAVPVPQWLVVYTRSTSQTGSDVFLRSVTPDGVVGAEETIDNSGHDDRNPRVSSPANPGNGETTYMVVYERPLTVRGMVRMIRASGLKLAHMFDLETQFSIGRYQPSVETDGLRYVVTASRVNPSSTLPNFTRVLTFTHDRLFGLSVQDAGIVPGVVTETSIAAQSSSGGLLGRYAIAHLQLASGFRQPALTLHDGCTSGPMIETVNTACDDLVLEASGSTAAGNAIEFALSNFGGDLPALVFGGASVVPLPLCGTCALGLRLDLPLFGYPGTSALRLAIPRDLGLVGASFAMQGVGLGSTGCFGGVRFSDTIRFTIR